MAKQERIEDKYNLVEEFRKEIDSYNKYNLDESLIRNSELFGRIADIHARAQGDVREIKRDIEKLEAVLGDKIREEAEDKNIRATKDYVDSKVILSPDMERMRVQLAKAERRMDEFLVLKEQYRERSYSIRGLIDLYEANYYETESGGSRKRDAVEDMADRNRKATGKLRRERRFRQE